MRFLAGCLAVATIGLLAACASANSPAATTQSSRPTAAGSPTPARLVASDAMLGGPDNEAIFLFKTSGDARLRGVTWDGASNGVLTASGSSGLWSSQSPNGFYIVQNGTLYDRHAHSLGALSWLGKGVSPDWSVDSQLMCGASPALPVTGSTMRLEVAAPGRPPRTVLSGFTTYSDNAAYPVLACDPHRDRVVVAVSPQGVSPAHVWIIKLSTGAVVRSFDTGGWVAVSGDGSMLARSAPDSSGTWHTTIERADDGAQLGRVDGFSAHGFSADAALLVGTAGAAEVVLLDWRSGRRVWSISGPYGGYRVEPDGSHVAIGIGFIGGSPQADVYIVSPDGSSILLPERVQAALDY